MYSSPFTRCIHTALPLSRDMHLSIKVDFGFREWLDPNSYKSMPEVMSVAELTSRYSIVDPTYGGEIFPEFPETPEQFVLRCKKMIDTIAARHRGDGTVVIVTHAGNLVAMTTQLIGKTSMGCGLCSLVELVRDENETLGWKAMRLGSCDHLKDGEEDSVTGLPVEYWKA